MSELSIRALAPSLAVAVLCAMGCGSSTGGADTGLDGGGPALDGGHGGTDGSPPNDGHPIDAAAADTSPQLDAALPVDAAPPEDAAAQNDAAPPEDAASPTDAASPADASGTDVGVTTDGATPTDSVPACLVPAPAIDVMRPTVTIGRASGQVTPATTLPIRFAMTFSEPIDVSTLTAADFVLSPAYDFTAELVDSGDHTSFELRLTAVPSLDVAQYRVTLPANRAQDLAGNPNEPSTSLSNYVGFMLASPTVQILPTSGVTATNVLPCSFSIQFQHYIDDATLTASDIVNRGTATGVQWQLTTSSAGATYSVQAVGVGSPGTLIPAIPAGAVEDALHNPNLESVYLGRPIMYTPLPILRVGDASAEEGDSIRFSVRIQPSAPAGVLFDWTTVDGTARAGTDYLAASGANVAIPTGATQVSLSVAATPEDLVPEPHRSFRLDLSNIRGAVYVDQSTAQGTVVNDDRGIASYSANGSSPGAGADWMMIEGSEVHVYGTDPDGGALKYRRDLTNDSVLEALVVASGQRSAGLAGNNAGYFFAHADSAGGFTLKKFDSTTDWLATGFGTFGEVKRSTPGQSYSPVAVAADEGAVYVVGSRSGLDGDPSWYIEKLDATTGTPPAAFGDAGVLLVSHAGGTIPEQATRALSDSTSLYLLGHVGTTWRIERRAASNGALVATFGGGGVLELPCLTRAEDFALHDGALYVIGEGSAATIVSRHDATTGALAWAHTSVMDVAGAVAAAASGLFIGGSRAGAWHVERWALDGTPIWAQTFNRDKAPSCARALVIGPDHWVYAAGDHSMNGDHDFYYERRAITDGLLHIGGPAAPPE